MVKEPAAANNRPSSYPELLAVRVMVAAIGLASTQTLRVLASNSSTHEYMKQKNIVTPIPVVIVGIKIRMKNLQNEYPSRNAVSSNSVHLT